MQRIVSPTVSGCKTTSRTLRFAGLTAVALSLMNAGTIQAAPPESKFPIVITEDAIMDFGSVVAPVGASANFVLDPADTVTACPTTCLGIPVSGAFTVTGKKNQAVTISFSTGDTLTGPGPAMLLGAFTHDAGASPTMDALGALSFSVGATLTVGDSQTDGDYSGVYVLTINYN